MAGACLIVYTNSVPYVKNILTALSEALQDIYDQKFRMLVCSSVDSAEIEDEEFIFVIGENFDRFKRLAGRRYIYLNFSVVAILGNIFQCSMKGIKLINKKKRLLQRKLDQFDALLDYYPSQIRHLEQTLNIPVAGFVPWIPPLPQRKIAHIDLPYDVCFVGSLSPRRKHVLEQLRAAGCVLSPSSGVNAEDIAAQSRCTINIHMQCSNHLEIPRVLGVLAASSTLITENSYGIHELLPKELIQVVPYRKLVTQTLATLADPITAEETAQLAHRWYVEIGAPHFKETFVSAVKKIQFSI